MLITQYVLLLWPGKHLPSQSIYHMHDVLPASETLFPHFLWEDSSDTALFGKLHVSGHMWEMKYRLNGMDSIPTNGRLPPMGIMAVRLLTLAG